MMYALGILVVAALIAVPQAAATVSDAEHGADGVLTHSVVSLYQAGQTEIKVLLPDRLEHGKRYPVVYVLPVEAGSDTRYGDGLVEVKQRDLHNKHRVIFVTPTFSHLPWYADHPTDPEIRQETHFLEIVVPFIEERYPVQKEPGGRFLLGFSKSGWGALSPLLRHPEVFGKAVAWDAPLMKDKPDQFGMEGIFGTQENFEKFQITRLFQQRADEMRRSTRVILLGYGNFRQQHQETHALLQSLGIPHDYRDGPERKHDWHSEWVEEAVGLLFQHSPAAGQ